jgi:hypothetical protein
MMAMRFLKKFRDLNADIASTIPALQSKKTLLDLVLSTTEATAMRDMSELLDTLKTQTQYGVFYIFDEHNELFRKSDEGYSALHDHPAFLRGFTVWTGPTRGVRSILYDLN